MRSHFSLISVAISIIALSFVAWFTVKDSERCSKEMAEIKNQENLPEAMEFFYSKRWLIFNISLMLLPTIILFKLNTIAFWAPQKHPNDFLAGIILGVIFLPFTILFGWGVIQNAKRLIHINQPAVTISRDGYRYENMTYTWSSVDSMKTSGRNPSLLIQHKMINDEKGRIVCIPLSNLAQPYLPEYAEKYWASFSPK